VHLQAFTTRFNDLCGWVASEICTQSNLKRRVDTIRQVSGNGLWIATSSRDFQFIKVATWLLKLQNYNALFAIISGLASPDVTRLKQARQAFGG
jgi:hypothetical protein